MSTVHEINDPADLVGLRLVWNSLLPETPGVSFFQTLDWLQTYWRHYGAGKRLRVLVVYSAGRPIGILPLVVRAERRRLCSLRILSYPLDDWGSFYGPIGPNPTATLLAGLGHLARTSRDWDLIELAWVDAAVTDRGRTPEALRMVGLPGSGELRQSSALVNLGEFETWDAYWASRTSRWRNNVRRSEKKLAQQGTIEHLRYRPAGAAFGDADPRWDLYDACEALARGSWQGDSDSGTTLTHDAVRPFLRDCHQVAAESGGLDLNLLLLNGQPVAFNYAYHYRGHVFGLRTGFNRHLGDGAGSTLQQRMIADSFARGDQLYDLGAGYLDCKRYWETERRQAYRYTHFNTRVARAQVMRLKRSVQRMLPRTAPTGSNPGATKQAATAE